MSKTNFLSKELFSQKCDTLFTPNFYVQDEYEIAHIFHKAIINEDNLEIKDSLDLMYKIFSCHLDLESKDIFKASFTNSEKRSFIPEDLNQDELNYLAEILSEIKQPFLKSRIADILWSYYKPKNIKHARTAIENYIKIDFINFSILNYQHLHRAASLAKSTGQQDLVVQIEDKMLSEIKNPTSDWNFHKLNLSEIFLKTDLDKGIYINLAEELLSEVQKFSSEPDKFNEIEQYLSLAKELFDKAKNEDKKIECIYLLAQATEKHGDSKILTSYMVANHFYKLALQIYRNIPRKYRDSYDIEESLKNIENKITNSGNSIINEMKHIEVKQDIFQLQQQSIMHVTDKKTVFEALCYLSGVGSISYSSILKNSKEQMKRSILHHIAFQSVLSRDGRRVDTIEPLKADNSNYDKVIFKTAIKNFSICVNISVFGCILPALEQIQKEHVISKAFLIELCQHSSIVPPKRAELIANALYYGFERDFATSIHLLAPQVENMIRQLLKKHGVITTHTDENGIEHENGLSSLVDKEEAKDILGEDLWFQLQAVFTSSLGANLRNEVGHGLLDDETSHSFYSIYAWWMILRIIIRSI